MQHSNRMLLEQGLREFGLAPSEEALQAIALHLGMVAEWNERVNLTALKDERDMVLKHAVDSASVVSVLQPAPGTRMIDIGTGAGFPGITLKCLFPKTDLVLLESLQKRCRFLEAVQQEVLEPVLGVHSGYKVVWGRAEDFGLQGEYREAFDLVLARAVAELRVLAEYCLPFCRVGGDFVAMKGPSAMEEIEAAHRAVELLGGSVVEAKMIQLPDDAGERTIVRIKKIKATPKGYPRKAGTPAKSPL